MKTKILITGGCGYIGSRVAQVLSKKYKVIVVDKVAPKTKRIKFPKEIEFRKADLKIREATNQVLKGVDYILHLAANMGPLNYMYEHQAEIIQENCAIDLNVYSLAVKNKVKGIVYSSSSMVFQHPPQFPYTEKDIGKINPPTNIYGFSKLVGEYFCKAYKNQYNLPYTIIRYHNVYGPREEFKGSSFGDIHVISALLNKIIIEKQYPLELIGDPNATRPFVYIDDVVRATIMILEKMIGGDSNVINNDFNVVSSESVKIKHLAKLMWDLVGDKRPFQYKVISTSADTAKRREGDISKIKKFIGWEPKVSLKEGILHTAEWIKQNGK